MGKEHSIHGEIERNTQKQKAGRTRGIGRRGERAQSLRLMSSKSRLQFLSPFYN